MSTRLWVLRCGGVRGNIGLPAANPYDPIDIINDWKGKRVTIWKTIWSLFLMCGANGFEGVGEAWGWGMVGEWFVGLTESKHRV